MSTRRSDHVLPFCPERVTRGGSIALASVAMFCFAANSLFCRMAMTIGETDPLTYTLIRIASAAAALSFIVWMRASRLPRIRDVNLQSMWALLVYLLTFAFAYARLGTGIGALVLFGAVQLSMFAVAVFEGEKVKRLSWAGNVIAVAGLVYLVQPWGSAPDPVGVLAMAVSGVAWGAFSLIARGADEPIEANAAVFIWCLLAIGIVAIATPSKLVAAPAGIWLAIASGTVSSGLGYIVWYRALRSLPASRAAIVQLSVPALAAIGGTILLAEPVTLRLVIASMALLGGVALALAQQDTRANG